MTPVISVLKKFLNKESELTVSGLKAVDLAISVASGCLMIETFILQFMNLLMHGFLLKQKTSGCHLQAL